MTAAGINKYLTISAKSEGLYKDKGSRFISLAFPVSSEIEVKQLLSDLRKQYHDARHHCYAYRIGADGTNLRNSDDGEPSGTAGRPIAGQILSKGVTNILIVVVRYFGGTKLGVSGLINAYKQAAIAALENSKIIEESVKEVLEIQFLYEYINNVMKILKDYNAMITEQDFGEKCIIKCYMNLSDKEIIISRLEKINNITLI